ncbi:hypothetical protein MAMP_00364 [Methylophaga aminisulfidivorans MP]|jgi:hypothetical protein|uniref:Uncharacterized protein n=1 Tax=Methylophaga aminisulfidivorans MP TaxID=1026882 RepID=F5T0W4_9GAMM|nr:hypothetical protein MAMP_00364 [Methylophaga aminisulfidivorans MP]
MLLTRLSTENVNEILLRPIIKFDTRKKRYFSKTVNKDEPCFYRPFFYFFRRTLMHRHKSETESQRMMLWYEVIEKLIEIYQYCDKQGIIDMLMSIFM